MKSEQITVRLDAHLLLELNKEAAFRKQTTASLARSLIRDGLAQYNLLTESLLESSVKVDATLAVLESLTNAILHVSILQKTIKVSPLEGEGESDYHLRLKQIYVDTVNDSILKGALISKFIRSK